MEFLFEIVFQFVGEILLQIGFEVLAELGQHRLSNRLRKPRDPILSTIGFILCGAIAGGISLLILPASPIRNPDLRMINLIVTPVIASAVMMLIGRLRDRKGQDLVRLDRFGYAFVFAFSMALVRFIWVS